MTPNQKAFAARTFAERSAARRATYARRYNKPRRFDAGDATAVALVVILTPLLAWLFAGAFL